MDRFLVRKHASFSLLSLVRGFADFVASADEDEDVARLAG
jgi:hypothetical protein